MSDFIQAGPELNNTYLQDRWLQAYLRYKLPPQMLNQVESDLRELGEKCARALPRVGAPGGA